jgi:hypothetical protein
MSHGSVRADILREKYWRRVMAEGMRVEPDLEFIKYLKNAGCLSVVQRYQAISQKGNDLGAMGFEG